MGLRLEHPERGLVFPQQPADLALGIVQIADDARLADAALHAGGQQPCLQPVGAEGALVGGVGLMVDEAGVIGTGLHAVAAGDAPVVVDHHYAVLALEGGAGGADIEAGGLGAVVAEPGQHEEGGGGIEGRHVAHLVLADRGAKLAEGGLVLYGAGHGAGLAADAAAQIDQHAVALATIPPAYGRPLIAGDGYGLGLNLGLSHGDQGRPRGEGGDPG
ncbi:hypothetical protein D3C79_814890 [compost metagenome]